MTLLSYFMGWHQSSRSAKHYKPGPSAHKRNVFVLLVQLRTSKWQTLLAGMMILSSMTQTTTTNLHR